MAEIDLEDSAASAGHGGQERRSPAGVMLPDVYVPIYAIPTRNIAPDD